MKLIAGLLSLTLFFSANLLLAAPQDDRRIEEQKREDLLKTKTRPMPKKQETGHLDDIDAFYLAELTIRKVTYRYDICKALVILKGVEKDYIDLDSQIAYLKQEGLLPKALHDNFDAVQPLRKGLTAYIIRKMLKLKGGVMLHVFKESERYALNELVYEGIMPAGNTNDILTGDELSSIITQTANYLVNQQNKE